MVRVELRSITINDTGDRQYINLAEVDGDRTLPIVIGYAEAQAIDRFVKGERLMRPMTHDLLRNLIEASGCDLEHVEITELRDATYYALIRLSRPDGSAAEVDARPSDAIALATSISAPIFVAEDVFETAVKP